MRGGCAAGGVRSIMEVKHAAREWLQWKQAGRSWSEKHREKVVRFCDRLVGFFGSKEVAAIQVGGVRLFEQACSQGRSAAAANFDLIYCRGFFRYCAVQGWAQGDPTVLWKTRDALPDADEKYTFYTREERAALKASIREDLRAFVAFSFLTGLRQSTVRLLRWKWLSREGVLCVPPKAVKNRVPIRQGLPLALVNELGPRGRGEDLIFPELPPWPQQIWKEFQKACRRAGLRAGGPQDMRRSFANQLAMNGVPMPAIMRLGGWRSQATVERYYLSNVPDTMSREMLEGLL